MIYILLCEIVDDYNWLSATRFMK